jgi:glucokinase-like ROK family protein
MMVRSQGSTDADLPAMWLGPADGTGPRARQKWELLRAMGKRRDAAGYHRRMHEPPTATRPSGTAAPTLDAIDRTSLAPLPSEVLDSFVTVVDEIRLGRSGSRSELVEHTGLGRAIVARRVGELIDRRLVSEGELGPSTGGRPPRQLSFRADAGHVLVADLGATSIDVAVTSLDGRILGHHDEPSRIEAGPEACLERVDVLFEAILRTTRNLPGNLWGVGIGVPGPVEFRTGRPSSPPIMPGWDGYPIRERFAARYGAPVWVDNDVNVLALGEWRSGIAVGHDDVVVVKIGTGIGAGIISHGRIHRGAQGSAGDVGHIQVVDDPSVVCRCGNIGCLEALAGGGALGRAGEVAALEGRSVRLRAARDAHGEVSAEDVARAASFGDVEAVALLQSAGRRIGSMLASVVNFFNPSLIVIGGGVANSPDQLMAAIRETIYHRSLPLATRELEIRRSSLGGLAGVVGASAMVVDQLFARESITHWIDVGEPGASPDIVQAATV